MFWSIARDYVLLEADRVQEGLVRLFGAGRGRTTVEHDEQCAKLDRASCDARHGVLSMYVPNWVEEDGTTKLVSSKKDWDMVNLHARIA